MAVRFAVDYSSGFQGIYTLESVCAGFTFTKIADTSGGFDYVGTPRGLNDSGTVSFYAGNALYTWNSGNLTTIASGVGDNGHSMNNDGIVAFVGQQGLYSGNGDESDE